MAIALCLNSNTYHGFSLEDAIEGASRSGIGLIELSAVVGHTEHVSADATDAEIVKLQERLAARNIRAVALGGHSNLTKEDGRSQLLRNLRLARRLGVDYLVTGTGETHDDEVSIEDEGEFVGNLRLIAESAALEGVRIAIETHGANYATGMQVKTLVDQAGSPWMGVCYDTGNTIFYGDTLPYDDLAESLPTVIGLHLKDKTGAASEWNFPAIGSGDIDFARVLRILQQDLRDKVVPVSIEIEFTPAGPVDVNEVHEAVARSVATLRSLGYEEQVR